MARKSNRTMKLRPETAGILSAYLIIGGALATFYVVHRQLKKRL